MINIEKIYEIYLDQFSLGSSSPGKCYLKPAIHVVVLLSVTTVWITGQGLPAPAWCTHTTTTTNLWGFQLAIDSLKDRLVVVGIFIVSWNKFGKSKQITIEHTSLKSIYSINLIVSSFVTVILLLTWNFWLEDYFTKCIIILYSVFLFYAVQGLEL